MATIFLAINNTDLINAFKLMGLGMAGIFVVMMVIFGAIKLLGHFTKNRVE